MEGVICEKQLSAMTIAKEKWDGRVYFVFSWFRKHKHSMLSKTLADTMFGNYVITPYRL